MRLGLFVAVVALVGCSGGDEHEEGPICSELSEACHEAGEVDAEAEACHDIAHEADEDACDAELDRCKTLCEAVPLE